MKKNNKKKTHQDVETVYWTEITYTCPKRGKVTERVPVKKLKAQPVPDMSQTYELDILKEDKDED